VSILGLFVDRVVGHSCPSQPMIASSTQGAERYKSDAYVFCESAGPVPMMGKREFIST
jgi:hypothetical protein